MTVESKRYWVIGLILASIFLYILTIIIDSAVDKISVKVSGTINYRNASPKMPSLTGFQSSNYLLLVKSLANAIFVIASFTVILFLRFDLFLLLVAEMACLFFFVDLLSRNEKQFMESIMQSMKSKPKVVLNVFQSVSFIFAFSYLVYPLVFDKEVNLLLTLILFLIIRQSLKSLNTTIYSFVRLSGNKHGFSSLSNGS